MMNNRRNAERFREQYESLPFGAPPTAEQRAEWEAERAEQERIREDVRTHYNGRGHDVQELRDWLRGPPGR